MTYQELRRVLDRLADDKADGQDVGDRLDAVDAAMVEAWGELTHDQSRDLFARVKALRDQQ